MFKKMKLSVKLIGGFLVVAFIALVLGFASWRGASSLGGRLNDLTQVVLPGVKHLLETAKCMESLRVSQRTLLNPELTREDRQRQQANFLQYREKYRQAMREYEALPKTPEETRLWQQFTQAVDAWRKENEEFLRLQRELEKTGIHNPFGFERQNGVVQG